MTAKKYLGQIRRRKWEIQKLEKEIKRLREEKSAITVSQYDTDKGLSEPSETPPYVRIIDKLNDIETSYLLKKEEYETIRSTIIRQILRMNVKAEAELLYLRYVEHVEPGDIPEKIGYSYDWVRHTISDALKHFEDQFGPFD